MTGLGMSLVSGDSLTRLKHFPRVVSGEWRFGAQMAAEKHWFFTQNTSQELTRVCRTPPVMIQGAAAQGPALHPGEREHRARRERAAPGAPGSPRLCTARSGDEDGVPMRPPSLERPSLRSTDKAVRKAREALSGSSAESRVLAGSPGAARLPRSRRPL